MIGLKIYYVSYIYRMTTDEVETVASENRGIAEALVVLQEYLKESENKKELNMVIDRLHQRLDWTIYKLKSLKAKEVEYFDPNDNKNEIVESKNE